MNTVADIRSLEREESASACAAPGLKAPSGAHAVWDNRLLRFALISLLIHGLVLIAAFVFFVGSPDSGSGQSFIVVEISGLAGGGAGGVGGGAGASTATQAKAVRVAKNTAAPVVAGHKIKAPKTKAPAVVRVHQPATKASPPVREAGLRKVTLASAIPVKPAPHAKRVERAHEEVVPIDKGAATAQMPSFAAEPTLTPANRGETYLSVAQDNASTGLQASTVGRANVSDVSFALPAGPSPGLGPTGGAGAGGAGQGGAGGGAGSGARIEGLKAPSYPSLSRLKGEEGTVELRVKVGADGRQKEVTLQRSSGFARLDRAAIKAIKRARFIPAMTYGRPVPSTKTVAFVFKLKD